jgi:5-methylcytosine-specific restriction endonuclease McrA
VGHRARCRRSSLSARFGKGATDELHFDHVVPLSKGGTSMVEGNIQLLCARHNLEKSAKIQ